MRLALLVLGLALAASAGEEGLPALLRRLGSDSWAEREQAQAALISLGHRIREPLAKAMEETRDPEVQARLERILSRLGKPDWKTGLSQALREARETGKPLLVMGSVGALEGYT